jgi:hypothetical protein
MKMILAVQVITKQEQLISNGGRYNPAFAERDRKQTMIDLRGIASNWFKNQFCPSIRLARLRALSSMTNSPFFSLFIPFSVSSMFIFFLLSLCHFSSFLSTNHEVEDEGE